MAEDDPAPRVATVRSYAVLEETPDDNIVVIGTFEGRDPDDACWAAVDKHFDKQATAAGNAEVDKATGKPVTGPRLAGVLAERLNFEEYVKEPVETTRRVKR